MSTNTQLSLFGTAVQAPLPTATGEPGPEPTRVPWVTGVPTSKAAAALMEHSGRAQTHAAHVEAILATDHAAGGRGLTEAEVAAALLHRGVRAKYVHPRLWQLVKDRAVRVATDAAGREVTRRGIGQRTAMRVYVWVPPGERTPPAPDAGKEQDG